jgi:hypothetical protein
MQLQNIAGGSAALRRGRSTRVMPKAQARTNALTSAPSRSISKGSLRPLLGCTEWQTLKRHVAEVEFRPVRKPLEGSIQISPTWRGQSASPKPRMCGCE